MTNPNKEVKECDCKDCIQEFKNGEFHCSGVKICPCHTKSKEEIIWDIIDNATCKHCGVKIKIGRWNRFWLKRVIKMLSPDMTIDEVVDFIRQRTGHI